MKGNSEPSLAPVVRVGGPTWAGEDAVPNKDVVFKDVGAAGDAPAQATARTQKPMITNRIVGLSGGIFSEARPANVVAEPEGDDVPHLL